jgi:hypothetical protein
VVGIDPVEGFVRFIESAPEPERAGQLRAGLVGRRRVAAGLGGLDRRAEPCLRGRRIVVVPEIVEPVHAG